MDLQRAIEARFGVKMHERTVGKNLAGLGFRRLSVRPQRPISDPEAQEAFKKLFRNSIGYPAGTRPGQAPGGVVPGRSAGRPAGYPHPHLDRTRTPPPRDTRYKWTYLFGAVCPERGATTVLVTPHADTEAMNAHLVEISQTVAKGAQAILVLDGAGWHGSKTLNFPKNITLLLPPPYAPELDPIENVWAYLRANRLAISVFETYEKIVTRCCDAWNFLPGDIDAVKSITSR